MPKYEYLIDPYENSVKEVTHEYAILNERHVQVMWLEQKYFQSLTTLSGKAVKVVSPGIWNAEEGPDFKKAHLIIGDKDFYGDIEIHLSDQGWKQHEHHLDSNYNNVIFHLSLWNSATNRNICTQNNKPIECAYLQDHLTISQKRIVQLIDLELYPYKRFCGTGDCAQKLFKKLAEKKIVELFQDASEWRLIKKKERLEARIDDPQLYFPLGIAMALGYKKNTESFIDLFKSFLENRELNEMELLAVGMNSFGYFSNHYIKYWKDSPYYNALYACNSNKAHSLKNPSIPLYIAHIRPINHPIRRIAYLIKLIKDQQLHNFFFLLRKYWNDSWNQIKTKKEQREFILSLANFIPTYEDPYWNFHYTFETTPKKKTIPLIGHPLKIEILINTVFPLLHADVTSRGNCNEIKFFFDLYTAIKSHESQKAKYLKQRFFGNGAKAELLKNANILQGAYQIHYDFCVHYESSCKGCPFVDKYKNNYE